MIFLDLVLDWAFNGWAEAGGETIRIMSHLLGYLDD